jgi:hypothetical protein
LQLYAFSQGYRRTEFVGHICKLCAVEVELMDGAGKAVINVVVVVSKIIKKWENMCLKHNS